MMDAIAAALSAKKVMVSSVAAVGGIVALSFTVESIAVLLTALATLAGIIFGGIATLKKTNRETVLALEEMKLKTMQAVEAIDETRKTVGDVKTKTEAIGALVDGAASAAVAREAALQKELVLMRALLAEKRETASTLAAATAASSPATAAPVAEEHLQEIETNTKETANTLKGTATALKDTADSLKGKANE